MADQQLYKAVVEILVNLNLKQEINLRLSRILGLIAKSLRLKLLIEVVDMVGWVEKGSKSLFVALHTALFVKLTQSPSSSFNRHFAQHTYQGSGKGVGVVFEISDEF